MSSFARAVRRLFTRAVPVASASARRRGASALYFDYLEKRQFLSASLLVTGNNNSIANGQATPSVTTFTNFSNASTTANSALGFVTRTYVVTNTTQSTITLNGGPSVVNITGTNAADFTLVTPPAASLASGASTSFTIQFQPSAAGTRTAVVSFTDSSSDVPTFSFHVSGTGVNTVNSSSTLEVGTTQAGTGVVTAVNGDVLEVSYTGYLLNGTVFDSTAQDGGTPLTFRLDDTPGNLYANPDTDKTGNRGVDQLLIDGWEQGLQGVKVGESRTLIIPASLGFGSNIPPHTTIPPNSTLIYEITVLQIAYSPEIGVQGNGLNIPGGTTTTTTTNGTDFGTITTASATHSFSLLDYSEAIDSSGNLIDGLTVPSASITGANASDFSIVSTAAGQFSVTFTPSAVGTRTAVVNLFSNDANFSDFTFAVSGTTTATQDLALTIGATNFPATIAAGTAATVSLPLVVQNIGNSPIAASSSAALQVYLQDTTTGTMTQLPGPFNALNVSSLAGGGSKSFTVAVTLPASVAIGTYKIIAVTNASGTISEATLANDSAATTQLVNVVTPSAAAPFSGALVSSTLAATPFAGLALSGKVALVVTNATGAVLPKKQAIVMTVVAHNLTTGADTTLYTSPAKSVSALKAGASAKESLTLKSPAGLATGSYQLEVEVAAATAIGSFSTVPSVVSTTAAGGVIAINAVTPTYDLSGSLVKSAVKEVKGALSGTVSVNVRSAGNAALSASQQVQVQIIAHPVGAANSSQDVILKTSPFSVKNWKTGKSGNFNVAIKGVGLPAGTYDIEAQIVTAPTLAETTLANNLLTTTAAGATLTLTVA